MANRNTRIRGLQVLDKGIDTAQIADSAVEALQLNTDAVETLKIKDNNVTLAKLADGTDAQMIICDGDGYPTYVAVSGGDVSINNAGSATIGATKVTDAMINDDVATGLAGDGLEASSGVMAIDLKTNDGLKIDTAELTVDYDNSTIGIISNALAVKDEGITEAKINADNAPATSKVLGWSGSQFSWVTGITENNLIMNEVLTKDTGSDVDFTLANSPVADSVTVYLNGLLQQPGTGEDYLIDGSTITFAENVEDTDVVIACYYIS